MALLQSPFLQDIVLSVADWTWALWLLGGPHVPLITSPPSPILYTSATWSCSRPGTQHSRMVLTPHSMFDGLLAAA